MVEKLLILSMTLSIVSVFFSIRTAILVEKLQRLEAQRQDV